MRRTIAVLAAAWVVGCENLPLAGAAPDVEIEVTDEAEWDLGDASALPVADAFVRSGTYANTAYGSSSSVAIDADDDGSVKQGYMRFLLQESRPIARAYVRIYVTNDSRDSADVYLISNGTWPESQLTWNSRPALDGRLLKTITSASIKKWVDIDVTAALVPGRPLSLAFIGRSSDGFAFASKESSSKPSLIIELARSDAGQALLDAGVQVDAGVPVDAGRPPLDAGTPNNSPIFVGAGDIAGCESGANGEATARILDGLFANGANANGQVFTLGDNAYPDGTASQFQSCYHPTWGRHKTRTRPSAGNHDYHTSDATGYFSYFGTAAADPSKGSYYSFNLGEWHIIALDYYVSLSSGSDQERWLRADLAANPNRCTIAYWHRPRFSSGHHGSSTSPQKLWQILYDANVDVVLNGHDHLYERFALQDPSGRLDPARGIRQFTVGTGGIGVEAVETRAANSEIVNTSGLGVLKLTLHPGRYDWQYLSEAGKSFTDQGSGSCH